MIKIKYLSSNQDKSKSIISPTSTQHYIRVPKWNKISIKKYNIYTYKHMNKKHTDGKRSKTLYYIIVEHLRESIKPIKIQSDFWQNQG